MGMFNDYRNTNRDTWNFTYTGEDLLPFAVQKSKEFKTKETSAREEVSTLLRDPNVRANDTRITDLKNDIETFGDLYEKCVIWCHEFRREAKKEYQLKLGDVSFFDIPLEFQEKMSKNEDGTSQLE